MSISQRQRMFLEAFAAAGSVSQAAAAAGIDRTAHYRWLREDADYSDAFNRSTEQAAGALEDLAVRRATEGLDEPLIYKGEIVWRRDPVTNQVELDEQGLPIALTVRRRSDALLQTLLKAWQPKKYRENYKIEADITHRGLADLTDEQLARIARGGSGGVAPPADCPE
jgi:hypothetical protein